MRDWLSKATRIVGVIIGIVMMIFLVIVLAVQPVLELMLASRVRVSNRLSAKQQGLEIFGRLEQFWRLAVQAQIG